MGTTVRTKLLQFHTLTNFGPSLVNRDRGGQPKAAPYAGGERSMISSQCSRRALKDGEEFLVFTGDDLQVRTRTVPQMVGDRLRANGQPDIKVRDIERKLTSLGTRGGGEEDVEEEAGAADSGTPTKRGGGKRRKVDEEETEGGDAGVAKTAQFAVVVESDVTALAQQLSDLYDTLGVDGWKAFDINTLAPLPMPRSVEIGLFGRKNTWNTLLDVAGALATANAVSVNAHQVAYDAYTTVDDMHAHYGIAPVGFLAQRPMVAPLYYAYWSLDVPQLFNNLGGDLDALQTAVKAVVYGLANLRYPAARTPNASDYAPALLYIEALQRKIGFNHLNAYVTPVSVPPGEPFDIELEAIRRLERHVASTWASYEVDRYGVATYFVREDHLAVMSSPRQPTLSRLAEWVLEAVSGGAHA